MIEGPIQTNNSGLVFYFDTKEPKSFIGKPTTNLLSNPTNEVIGTTSEFVQYADLAPIFNTYGTSVTYSLSLDLKAKKAGSVYVYMQNGSWTKYSFVGQSVNATTEYKRFTFNGLTAAISTPTETQAILAFYGGYGSGVIAAIKNVQVEISPAATPFVNGSRSNTQGLLDLTGNSTIDLTNAGYDVSSEITFDGSSNYITINKTAAQLGLTSGGQMTVEAFVRLSSLSGYTHIVDGSGNRWHLAVENSGDGASAYFWNGSSYHSTSSPAITANTWVYITGVQESSLLKIYINGVLATNGSLSSAASNLLQDCNIAMGYWQGNNSRYLNGQIGLVRIYNRALSASEILKNFNSQRSRYSV